MNATNHIEELKELVQKKGLELKFEDVSSEGSSHIQTFTVRAVLDGKAYANGVGKNKNEATQMAAKNALEGNLSDPVHGLVPVETAESTKAEPAQCSPLVVIVKEDPAAKEEAAQLVYHDVQNRTDDSETQETTDSMPVELNEDDSVSTAASSMSIAFEDEGFSERNIQSATRFLSNYDSIDILGKGGFGSVFKARHKLADRFYAIKIIRYKEKALREVKALAALSHVNIVRYYNCWMENTAYQCDSPDSSDSYSSSQTSEIVEKYVYIVMELCDTRTLKAWIEEKNSQNEKKSRRDPRRREESLKIAQQLVTGVEHIHSHALIHRDLKPVNVLFGGDGKVKIGDFGLVTTESNGEENVTERTYYKGTRSYMAPEQKTCTNYDRKVDIFALGLIYFELLWKTVTVQERQTIWDELRVQKLPEGFTRYFLQEGLIIKSMLSSEPRDRPEASEVMLELEKCAQAITNKNTHSV
ncbi:hypothetical protein NL108_002308 [Boleophthalmus pectinirostris]|uniref:eukaryotic translation initiation factor 2-alpha kinase 3 n=1 Tax=Boleophthalmus pectinirostris TaxID=150288 RepID=UPI00242C457B|nr:eukaryotic translation initiation factor 2-alpha kinase 3 [Boleophthalmus pectinirostris]KAJ0066767.1 hypothetical protein NL108_002308 [Boleophthalmus pectinirostris]